MFIFWNNHTSTVCGSSAKYVRCEQCLTEFGYVLHRESTGHAISLFFLDERGAAARAQRRADQGIRRALELGVEPRTCPKCNHLQQDMVREAKRRYLGWMSFRNVVLALLITPFALILSVLVINAFSGHRFLVPFPIFYSIWLGIIVLIIFMPFIRLAIAALYDPQRLSPEEKTRRGIYSGVLLEDWEAAQEKSEANLRQFGIPDLVQRHARPRSTFESEGQTEH